LPTPATVITCLGVKHPMRRMKPLTKKQQQWLWFAILWCTGLAATFLIAAGMRLLLSIS
jgi:hypothetical protein